MRPSQAERLLKFLSDGEPHSTVEILEQVYGGSHLGIARVGARIWDLKARGHDITGWKDPTNPAVYVYQMKVGSVAAFIEAAEKAKPIVQAMEERKVIRYETVERDGVRMVRRVEGRG